MRSRAYMLLPLLVSCSASPAWCQTQSLARGPHRMEITLERLDGSGSLWRAIDPGLVLEKNDRIRFRFRTNFDGYLYVMNLGTSGDYTQLFPREETGRENRIQSGQEYLVPATHSRFRVGGPPGQDIVYWMVTPGAVADAYVPLPPPPKQKPLPGSLTPRCDDALLRARGECIDSSAGPRQVPESGKLPENLAGVPGATSRSLVIMRQQSHSVLSSPQPLAGPVIYEFRLAHK